MYDLTLGPCLWICSFLHDEMDHKCYGFGKIILGHPGRPSVITEMLLRQEGEWYKEGAQEWKGPLETQNGKENAILGTSIRNEILLTP